MTISKKHRIPITFLLLSSFLLKILFGFISNINAFQALAHLNRLSEYDATNYYLQSIYDVATQNTLIPELHWSIADPGFSILLYWIGKIYSFFFINCNISYFYFIYFLVFIHTLTFLYIFKYLEKHQNLSRLIIVVFSIYVLFEPMMLRFSFSLEREIIVSLLLLVFITAFMDNKWIVMIISGLSLIPFRDVYLYLVPTIFTIHFIYNKYAKTKFYVVLPIILIAFSLIVHILASNIEELERLFFHHGKDLGVSAFGDLVLSQSYCLRISIYSILGFIAPVPLYPFYANDYSTFYFLSLLFGLSSISYFFVNSYMIYSLYQFDHYSRINSLSTDQGINKIQKAYLVIFILHLTFHGLIYNIRHRLQIIPGLIVVFLYLLQFQKSIGIKISLIKWFSLCTMIVIGLNIFHYILKMLV